MEWGQELWDQFESVDRHHQHGIDFGEKYTKFVKERCAIEVEYASKLRKLVKGFQPKKRTEDRNIFSTHKAFQSQLAELNDIAGQHETVAEEMLSRICKTLLNFCNDLKLEKKKVYQDGRHQQYVLDQHEKALEQTKKKFEKEWKECERAQAYFEKLDADGNVTKADVEKAKHIWLARKDSVESCKTDYGSALQIFNKERQDHYTTHMPKLFQLYKEADERRIVKCQELMVEYANIDSAVKPIVQKCLDGMKNAANAIDPNLDAQLVVEKLKSGFLPPSDKEFEDFTQPQQKLQVEVRDGVENSPKNSVNSSRNPSKKGGLSWLFGNKKVVEAPDYSHLPPEQRRKKLQKIIDDFKKEINKEEDGRKAIVKMQDVYRANPALGDADSLAGQIKMSTANIEKLQADLTQHENWYADASGLVQAPSTQRSVSQRSLSNKPKEGSVTSPVQTEAPPLEPLEESKTLQKDQNIADDFDEEPEPIGTCVALYDFEASSEGALSMKTGDKFSVIEADNGDGWTRAMQDGVDGYVPTSYIEVNFFT